MMHNVLHIIMEMNAGNGSTPMDFLWFPSNTLGQKSFLDTKKPSNLPKDHIHRDQTFIWLLLIVGQLLNTGNPQPTTFNNGSKLCHPWGGEWHIYDHRTTSVVTWLQFRYLATSLHLWLVAASCGHVITICNLFFWFPAKITHWGGWPCFIAVNYHCKNCHKNRPDLTYNHNLTTEILPMGVERQGLSCTRCSTYCM